MKFSKRIKGVFRDLFFLHIFNQTDEELKNTANTLFTLSLVLLFLAILMALASIFVIAFVLNKEIGARFTSLDDYSIHASGFFLASVLLALFAKVGAFDKHRPFLVWLSFIFTAVGIVILAVTLFSLTLGKFKHLLLSHI